MVEKTGGATFLLFVFCRRQDERNLGIRPSGLRKKRNSSLVGARQNTLTAATAIVNALAMNASIAINPATNLKVKMVLLSTIKR
jgi:hypothetical protein